MKRKTLSSEDEIRRSRLKEAVNAQFPPMTKEELAEKTGYTLGYINKIFSGQRRISNTALHQFAQILNTRAEYLLGKDTVMTESDYRVKAQQSEGYSAAINISLGKSSDYYLVDKFFDVEAFDQKANDQRWSRAASEINSMLHQDLNEIIQNNRRVITKAVTFDHWFDSCVELSESDYYNLCDEVSDYICFKIEQLYRRLEKEQHKK